MKLRRQQRRVLLICSRALLLSLQDNVLCTPYLETGVINYIASIVMVTRSPRTKCVQCLSQQMKNQILANIFCYLAALFGTNATCFFITLQTSVMNAKLVLFLFTGFRSEENNLPCSKPVTALRNSNGIYDETYKLKLPVVRKQGVDLLKTNRWCM